MENKETWSVVLMDISGKKMTILKTTKLKDSNSVVEEIKTYSLNDLWIRPRYPDPVASYGANSTLEDRWRNRIASDECSVTLSLDGANSTLRDP